MNIIVSKDELSRALSIINNIVEKKTTMPIMANVLISAEDGHVRFSGSDLEITALATAPAKVKERGSTTVNAKMLSEIVRELPGGDVALTLGDGERLEIKAHNTKLRIIGVSAQEYPSLPGLSIETKNKISAQTLLEMINNTIYAVSTDETRFNLSGVCFEMLEKDGTKIVRQKKASANGSLRLVATDGHRLALTTRPVDHVTFSGRVIAPRKGLAELRKILEECGDSEVGIEITEGFIVAETPTSKVSMRLVDGEFPDYARAFPDKDGTKVVVSSNDLSQALRRVALVVSDKQKCVKFDLSNGTLRISSSSPELGDATEELPIEYKGSPITVGFNAKYLLDITSALTEDQRLVMELNGETGPGKFYPEGDDSSIGIVMPMRIV